jgi:small GTP-binding protein
MAKAKLCLLGDVSCGKSCFATRFCTGEYNEDLPPTMGAAFLSGTVKANDTSVTFEIFDVSGEARSRMTAAMYYGASHVVVATFDVSSKDTYVNALAWFTEVKKRGPKGAVLAMVALKCDLDGEDRAVSEETARAYADGAGIMYFETSAKEDTGVVEPFCEVATALLDAGTIADEGPALRASSGGIFSRMLTAMSPRKGRDEHEDHPQEESVTPDESPHVDPGDVVVKPIAALGAAVASAAAGVGHFLVATKTVRVHVRSSWLFMRRIHQTRQQQACRTSY